MSGPQLRRYEQVSRRAMLKASLGTGAYALFAGLACAADDAEVFAGATAEPAAPTISAATSSTTEVESTTTTAEPAGEGQQPSGEAAVNGELVVVFTYTQGVGGKNARPYVAVWIEDAAGDLVETVALWYQQGRRGERWLDHLNRWFEVDADLVASGGTSNAETISSATRDAGSYAVVWDGLIGASPAAAGDYYVCIEASREEGPHSLIREPFNLTGSLAETSLPDDGELSGASVRIDA